MIQRIKIENFIRIPYLDLQVKRPVLLLVGSNEAGKTSFAEAIRFVMFGDNPRVMYKKDFDQLVTNGAKRGSVELTFNNYSVKRNVKDAKATGDTDALPTDSVVASIAFGVHRFVDLAPADRRGLLMRLMGVEITPEKITAELKERGINDTTIGRYEPIYKSGLAAAFDKADRITKESRGEWKGVTGENYGSEKAETWKPESVGISVAELNQGVADLDVEIAKLQTERDSVLQPILTRISEMDHVIDAQRGIPCPSCGTELLYQGGKLAMYAGASEAVKSMQVKLRLVQYQKRDEAKKKYDTDLQKLGTDRVALITQIRDDATAIQRTARAAAIHADIKDADTLRGLFGDGPDGILGRAVAKAVVPFNAMVGEIADAIGWQTVGVGGDMSVMRDDQVPYALLSESAQWRADVLLHVIIAQLARCPWLVFDRMDVLDPASRTQFIVWANKYGLANPQHTLVVLGTLKAKPDTHTLEAVQTEWIEAGELAKTLEEAVS